MAFYKTSKKAYFALCIAFRASAKQLAIWSCANTRQISSLCDCYNDAAQILSQIYKMTEHPNLSLGYLGDFFEVRPNGFSSFTDLMNFWAQADGAFPNEHEERQEHPDVFRILKTAKGFSASCTALSPFARLFLNTSLALDMAVFLRHIEQKSAEFASCSRLTVPS